MIWRNVSGSCVFLSHYASFWVGFMSTDGCLVGVWDESMERKWKHWEHGLEAYCMVGSIDFCNHYRSSGLMRKRIHDEYFAALLSQPEKITTHQISASIVEA